jgi:hypothetical protein
VEDLNIRKNKVLHQTFHERTEGEKRHSSSLSLTSELDEMGG